MGVKPLHFAGLNGLRAIAALAVVISHTTLHLAAFQLDPSVLGTFDGKPKGLDLAGYGVSIFFALSGFLITYLLLEEKDKQTIDVKKFYIRRILRIWPLYYLYLFITFGLILFYSLDFDPFLAFSYVFFAANVPAILGTPLTYLGHYWSIGVEEQFYLFWVWVVKKVKTDWLTHLIIYSIMGVMLLKLFLRFYNPESILNTIILMTRFHCMMIGALGAIILKNNKTFWLKLVDNKPVQAFAWFIIALLAINKYRLASIIDQEFISLITVILIIGQIRINNRLVNLENRVCDFLGKISYGIYIWHPFAILGLASLVGKIPLEPVYKYPFVYGSILILTIAIAYLSYTYIEKPFLKLKERFAVVASTPLSVPMGSIS